MQVEGHLDEAAGRDQALEVDHALHALAERARAHELELARWLLRAEALAVHRRFGFGSLGEYVERRLGLDRRELRERLRVARALTSLPLTTEALRCAEQSWSAVRELTRVATPQTEAEWLAHSRGRTVRQLERRVARHRPGDKPTTPRSEAHAIRRLVFEVVPEDLSKVRAALDLVWRALGGDPKAAAPGGLLVAMAEVVLGERQVATAAYQTAITVCAGCSRTWQRAGGELVEVSDAVAGCARCDGEVVGFAEVAAEDDALAQEEPRAQDGRESAEDATAEDARDEGEDGRCREATTHVGRDAEGGGERRARGDDGGGATHVGHGVTCAGGGDSATHVGHGETCAEIGSCAPHVGRERPPERPASASPTAVDDAAVLAYLRRLAAGGGGATHPALRDARAGSAPPLRHAPAPAHGHRARRRPLHRPRLRTLALHRRPPRRPSRRRRDESARQSGLPLYGPPPGDPRWRPVDRGFGVHGVGHPACGRRRVRSRMDVSGLALSRYARPRARGRSP